MSLPTPLRPPSRILMGPGPSDVPPSVLAAMSLPTLGHLDPAFIAVMEEVRSMLQALYGTASPLTLPLSGTGSAGMEACLVNLLEPGDAALVGVNGVFGERMCEVARRCGAEVVRVEAPWGRPLDPDDLLAAARRRRFRVVAGVHAETSTGVRNDPAALRAAADAAGSLLVLDTVTSLGGEPVELDAWRVDAAYSGTQKCLSAPPGLAPASFSPAAVERVRDRRRPPDSWYLDLRLLGAYWLGEGGRRAYHHTAPIHAVYALHEALRLALEEGLPARYARHRAVGAALQAGLEAMGLALPVPPEARLHQLTLVRVPEAVDEAAVRRHLLEAHGIEIGGGLGAFAGRAWRIGLMGASATPGHVLRCLAALDEALRLQGWTPAGDGRAVAEVRLDDPATGESAGT